MKRIDPALVRMTVARLCREANCRIRPDIQAALRRGSRRQRSALGRELYALLNDTVAIARKRDIPICQDTGYPVVFADIGPDVFVDAALKKAIIDGVKSGYCAGNLRASIVAPFKRDHPDVIPPVVHFDFVNKKGLTLTVLPKGFGSENKTALKLFKPTASFEAIAEFVVSSAKNAGASACPPFFIGIGIGGTADYALLLSKKALLKKFGSRPQDSNERKLTDTIIRKLGTVPFGIAGLSGAPVCLGVNIVTAPTHIAGLPVGVSISCWVMRSASKTILK